MNGFNDAVLTLQRRSGGKQVVQVIHQQVAVGAGGRPSLRAPHEDGMMVGRVRPTGAEAMRTEAPHNKNGLESGIQTDRKNGHATNPSQTTLRLKATIAMPSATIPARSIRPVIPIRTNGKTPKRSSLVP